MKKTKATGKAAENRQPESKAVDVEEEIRQLRERLLELDRRLKKIEGYR